MDGRPIVIVGAGHAGVQTAARLAELGRETVLIDQDEALPYERPPLSKDVLKGAVTTPNPLRKADFYAARGIARIGGKRVARVLRDSREIEFADGERLRYGKLILATGSTARTLPVPGSDLRGVRTLKTAADASALRGELAPGRRVVLVGAGYVGLEVAAAARSLGCAVTVIEAQDRVMSRVTSDVVSRFYEDLHRAEGTRFVFGEGVTAFEGAGAVEKVVTSSGEVHEADVVVAGIGVVPNQSLAEEAGLACADGVLVDRQCRTSDPDVYAVGDVVRQVCPEEGIDRRLESVQSAVAQGIAAADAIAGSDRVKAEVPWFWTVQHGVRLQTAGLREPGDEVLLRGTPGQGRFSVLYLRDGRLAAIDTVGSARDFAPARKLIASGALIDRGLAADPGVKLSQAQYLATV
ncbi:NAD(P)/FAD-dependent oxidoreductase [Amycolatopsis acidicola]|uniref:NAD(P)/FAD-dependent oxidoreductase n=1 Tax=Amycolatopsis acidicola TaxID=2596893 RepID=UPI00140ADBDD|nr:FAD-dependent oxidoreductase [Amycolatopsis acidicola]